MRRATSTAAASAEPPPSPAPGGMPLCSSIATVAPQRVGGAHTRGSSSSVGHAGGERARHRRSTSRVAGRITSSSCGSLTDDHERVELVVAVGARAGDVQRERELGERVDARLRRVPVASACASAAQSRERRASRRARADRCPRAANTRSASIAELRVERAPQHLAPGREAGAHELEHALGIARPRPAARRAGRSRTSALSTLGCGTNTVGGTVPDDLGLGVVRDLHRDRAVRLRARTRPRAAPPPRAAPSRGSGRSSARSRARARRPASRRCTAGSTTMIQRSWPREQLGPVDRRARRRARSRRRLPADDLRQHRQRAGGRARPRARARPRRTARA